MTDWTRVRAAALLLVAGLSTSIGCSDNGNSGTATTRTDASSSTPNTVGLDGGQPSARSDAASLDFDATGALQGTVLPPREAITGPALTGLCEVYVNDADCDETKLPIIFVHGTAANADSFAHPAQLFASNSYCPDRIRGVEYNSLISAATDGGAFALDGKATYAAAKKAIDAEIAKLQAEFGVTKVDLAGHSQGGGHGGTYARENPDKVAHYLNLAGAPLSADPSGVPTLSLSSIGDRPVDAGTSKSVIMQDVWLDHSAVSSSTEAFIEMYKFLNDGREPKHTTVQCGTPITLEGRAQTLGDNQVLPGARVEVYELGDSPRQRDGGTSFVLGEDGKFGPFEAKPGVMYEFKLVPPPGDITRRFAHAYMPPFLRSDRLLRFNFESKDPVGGGTSVQINRDRSFAVVVPRNREKAFLAERDTLTVGGREILTRDNTLTASPTTSPVVKSSVVAAIYLYDKSLTPGSYGPGDGTSTGESIVKGFFVNSADVFISTAVEQFVEVKFNGRTLKVPNWPSDSEGTSVVFVN